MTPQFSPPGEGWVQGPLFPPHLEKGPIETVRYEVSEVGKSDLGWVWHRPLQSSCGVWAAYYLDGSGIDVFGSELEALRHAVGKHMEVTFWPYGTSSTEVLK